MKRLKLLGAEGLRGERVAVSFSSFCMRCRGGLFLLGLFFCGLISGGPAWAAACCSGGSALPALITSDEASQLGVTVVAEKTIGDVTSQGQSIFRGRGDDEWNQVLQIAGATLLSDRFQVGGVLPLARRAHQYGAVTSVSDLGLGDLRVLAGYEAAPEWSYSPWRPKVFVYLSQAIPLGRSIHAAQKPYAVDAHGRGFFVPAAGALALKSWSLGFCDFGASLSGEVGRVLGRTFSEVQGASQGEEMTVGAAWNASGTGALSISRDDWSLGTSLGVFTEGSRTLSSPSLGESASARTRVWTAGATLTYLAAREWMVRAAYTDQTLMGPAQNTALLRSGSLSVTWLNPR